MATITGVHTSGSPAGTILPCGNASALPGTLLCNGDAVSRTTYANLFAAIAISFTTVTRNGTTTLTIGGSQNPLTLGVVAGMPISGTGIPGGATVVSATTTTIVISSPASGSGTSTAAVCPYGVGDGSNTFNLPDTRGIFLRGVGANPSNASNTTTLATRQLDELKSHSHSYTPPVFSHDEDPNGQGWNSFIAGGATSTGAAGGTETRPANVGVNYCIAY